MAKCDIEKLKAQFPDMDPKQIESMVAALEKIKGTPDYATRAKALRSDNILEAKAKAKNTISDTIAIKKFETDASTFKDSHEAFKAKFVGINRLKEEGNLNFMQVRQALKDRFLNLMKHAVPKEVRASIVNGDFDVEIADAMFLLNNNKQIGHLPAHVQTVAANFKGVNKQLIDTLKDAGVDIRERNDYITRQSHNREKITDFTEWSSDLLKEGVLDRNKTFGAISSDEDINKALRNIFNRIQDDGIENSIGVFGGERSIHFANGRSWADYNAKYGHGSISDSISATINSSSRAAASASVMGTMNGSKLWDASQKKIAKSLNAEGKFDELAEFKRGQRQRDAWKSEMFGYDRHPGKFNFESWSRTANLVQAGSLLGKAVITTITDLPFSSLNFRAVTGKKGVVEFDAIKTFLSNIKPSEFEYWSKATDMNFDDELAHIFDRFGAFTGGGKNTGVALDLYKKAASITGLTKQSGRAKVTNARMLSTHLGSMKDKAWADLEPRLSANLKRFGIGAKDWDIMREISREYDNGLKALVPEDIKNNRLRIKYATYLADNAKVGSPDVSGLERAFITQGLSPQSPMGAFLRTAGQFKSFSLSVPRVLGRISQSGPDASSIKKFGINIPTNKGDLALLGGVMVQATMLAGASIVAKKALKGEKVDVMSPAFMADAFTQGAVPLMFTYTMDALRGEYESKGRSFLKDLAGPTFGQLDDAFSVLAKTTQDLINVFEGKTSAGSKGAVAAMKLVMRNAPGQNLPLVKPLLNKAFLTSFYEHFNPGYEARLKRSAARRGTEFLFNPL